MCERCDKYIDNGAQQVGTSGFATMQNVVAAVTAVDAGDLPLVARMLGAMDRVELASFAISAVGSWHNAIGDLAMLTGRSTGELIESVGRSLATMEAIANARR